MRKWMFLGIGVLLLSSAFSWAAEKPAPTLAAERVVVRTTLGDMVFALYNQNAPEHTAQFLKLVRLGAYDSTFVYRVSPVFYVQICDVKDRLAPLSDEQRGAIHKLKGEFMPGTLCKRGALVMARDPLDPASAETSFIILLRDAPEMDGKNTVFGILEKGLDVLDAIASAEKNADGRPLSLIAIKNAEVLESVQSLTKTSPLKPAHFPAPIPTNPARKAMFDILAVLLIGVGAFLTVGSVYRSIGSLLILVGFFIAYAVYTPYGLSQPWIAVIIFASTVAIFFLMSSFERK